MFYGFGQRQRELLEKLLHRKSGLTIDELAKELGITRNAVQQHALSLEKGGYIEKGALTATGGRPGRVYILSNKGIDLFPKQYSWFSELLLNSLKSQLGTEGLGIKMHEIGKNLGESLKPKLTGMNLSEKIYAVSDIMQDLGFETEVTEEGEGSLPAIKAHNCIYHNLAKEFEEVCHLDRSLLESILESKIDHEECIIRGGEVCKFKISPLSHKQ
jgi:DeoR family transcriptional regulator, suf operon transcriptional repressor